jgi:NAD kinase
MYYSIDIDRNHFAIREIQSKPYFTKSAEKTLSQIQSVIARNLTDQTGNSAQDLLPDLQRIASQIADNYRQKERSVSTLTRKVCSIIKQVAALFGLASNQEKVREINEQVQSLPNRQSTAIEEKTDEARVSQEALDSTPEQEKKSSVDLQNSAPPLLDLPCELTTHISSFLDREEIQSLKNTHPLLREQLKEVWLKKTRFNLKIVEGNRELISFIKSHNPPHLNFKGYKYDQVIKIFSCLENKDFIRTIKIPLFKLKKIKEIVQNCPFLESIIVSGFYGRPSKQLEFEDLIFLSLFKRGDQRAIKIIFKAIPGILKLVSEKLKNNPEIVKIVVTESGYLLQHASEKLKNDPKIVKIAVTECGQALKFASEELKNDPEIVKIALAQDGFALQFASEELKNNPEIVKIAVAQNGWALKFASEEFKNDPEIVKIAVAQRGQALQFASEELKNNPEIVKIAVAQDGQALQFASEELKNNPEIVKIAVAQCGSSLYFASEELKNKLEIVQIAIAQNTRFIEFASSTIKRLYWKQGLTA